MPVYPAANMCECGKHRITFGLSDRLVHETWGFDLGERFRRDPVYRMETLRQIDRAVFDRFRDVGMGYKDPAARPSAEPFGHRSLPAMHGCKCAYAADCEPWAALRPYKDEEILALEDWTSEWLQNSASLRETAAQARLLHARYGEFSSLPDLGSVINAAVYLIGDDLFIAYPERPHNVRRLYDGITQLRILCVDCFARLSLSLHGIDNTTGDDKI